MCLLTSYSVRKKPSVIGKQQQQNKTKKTNKPKNRKNE